MENEDRKIFMNFLWENSHKTLLQIYIHEFFFSKNLDNDCIFTWIFSLFLMNVLSQGNINFSCSIL